MTGIADKIFGLQNEQDFEQIALDIFSLQAERCAPYRQCISLLGINPKHIDSIDKIPFLPIELFKSHDIYCGDTEPEKIFTSSNTGGTVASRHMMQRLAHYEQGIVVTIGEHLHYLNEVAACFSFCPQGTA